jgi:hypothetical protein
MKCTYHGYCKRAKGKNNKGKCPVLLKSPEYCRYRIPENFKAH